MGVRKNQSRLTRSEWRDFIAALDALRGPDAPAPAYGVFVRVHVDAMTTAEGMHWGVHTMLDMGMIGRNFLAWHRHTSCSSSASSSGSARTSRSPTGTGPGIGRSRRPSPQGRCFGASGSIRGPGLRSLGAADQPQPQHAQRQHHVPRLSGRARGPPRSGPQRGRRDHGHGVLARRPAVLAPPLLCRSTVGALAGKPPGRPSFEPERAPVARPCVRIAPVRKSRSPPSSTLSRSDTSTAEPRRRAASMCGAHAGERTTKGGAQPGYEAALKPGLALVVVYRPPFGSHLVRPPSNGRGKPSVEPRASQRHTHHASLNGTGPRLPGRPRSAGYGASNDARGESSRVRARPSRVCVVPG